MLSVRRVWIIDGMTLALTQHSVQALAPLIALFVVGPVVRWWWNRPWKSPYGDDQDQH